VHKINVSRSSESFCWTLEIDGQFEVSSPNRAIVGDAVLSAIDRFGETVQVTCVDHRPTLRERAEASRLAQEASRGHEVVAAPDRLAGNWLDQLGGAV
jgi:hypothetical protein